MLRARVFLILRASSACELQALKGRHSIAGGNAPGACEEGSPALTEPHLKSDATLTGSRNHARLSVGTAQGY